MTLLVLAFLGGILTIISPCILPVLPFVFARADRSFVQNGLPMLAGMALTFAVVATFASVAGGWVVEANQYGRIAALALMAAFGLTLVFPELADRLMRPLVGVGARLSASAERDAGAHDTAILPSLLLGVATGFLMGAVRGPGPWTDLDWCRAQWRERRNIILAPCLRGRCRDIAGCRSTPRRPGFYRDEALAGRRRVGQERSGHCGVDRRRCCRFGARYRLSHQRFAFQHRRD